MMLPPGTKHPYTHCPFCKTKLIENRESTRAYMLFIDGVGSDEVNNRKGYHILKKTGRTIHRCDNCCSNWLSNGTITRFGPNILLPLEKHTRMME